LKDSIAIAETSGIKVPGFAIEIEQAGEITSEQARELYIRNILAYDHYVYLREKSLKLLT